MSDLFKAPMDPHKLDEMERESEALHFVQRKQVAFNQFKIACPKLLKVQDMLLPIYYDWRDISCVKAFRPFRTVAITIEACFEDGAVPYDVPGAFKSKKYQDGFTVIKVFRLPGDSDSPWSLRGDIEF